MRAWAWGAEARSGDHSEAGVDSAASRGPSPASLCAFAAGVTHQASEEQRGVARESVAFGKASHSPSRSAARIRPALCQQHERRVHGGTEALGHIPFAARARASRRGARVSSASLLVLLSVLGQAEVSSGQGMPPFLPVWQWTDPSLFAKYNFKWPEEMAQGEHKVSLSALCITNAGVCVLAVSVRARN